MTEVAIPTSLWADPQKSLSEYWMSAGSVFLEMKALNMLLLECVLEAV